VDWILGLGVIAGFAFVYILVGKVVSRGIGAIEGAVTGNTRSRGLSAVRAQTNFVLPVSGPMFIDRLIELLELVEKPTFKNHLYVHAISEDRSQLVVGLGTPLQTSLQFLIDTEATESGCSGMATTVAWVESTSLVTSTDQIDRLHKFVRATVEQLGGTYLVGVSEKSL